MNNTFSLRQLPLPAKLVVSAFLIAVGIGYFSAMIQLHMQHSDRDGNALPTPENVIERFSGLKKADGKPSQSKIEMLISGAPDGGFDKNNMTPAFFEKSSKSGWPKELKERGEVLLTERENERQAMKAWLQLPAEEKKKAYETNSLPLPASLQGKPFTEDFVVKGQVQIKSLFETRCLLCHDQGGSNKPEMHNYDLLLPLITPPTTETIDDLFDKDKKWVKSSKQMSVEGLTQSTHAHLLSFAVLFSLTGLTFAFTSYPTFMRCILGPIVVVAQVADISCWWLARVEGYGPLFAQAIMLTGGIVGLGLTAQIVLSLFNLYGIKGKIVLVLLALAFAAGFGVLYVKVLGPTLKHEKAKSSVSTVKT
ncbi:MAG: hypothetical protein ACRC8S_12765 [Fimbriiglobus sp.]